MGYALLFLYLFIQPMCLGLLIRRIGKETVYCHTIWVWGSCLDILGFGIIYILQLNLNFSRVTGVQMLQAFFNITLVLSLILLVLSYWKNRERLAWKHLLLGEKLSDHKLLLVAFLVLIVGILLSVTMVNHNSYGKSLIGYEYLFRLDTNQLEYYDFIEKNTSMWLKVFKSGPIMYYFMYINEITKLPPVLFGEGVTLLWDLFMALGIHLQIGDYFFYENKKKRDALVLGLSICFILAVFSSNMVNFQLLVGPWDSNVVLSCLAVPTIFLFGVRFIEDLTCGQPAYRRLGIDYLMLLAGIIFVSLCKWWCADFVVPLGVGMLVIGCTWRFWHVRDI